MDCADLDFIEAVHAIYQSIENEIEASRDGAKAWAKSFYAGQDIRKDAVCRVVEGLDPK